MTSDSVSILTRSLTDLRALQRYTIEVFELQQSEPELKTFAPAARLIDETISTLRLQIENLDRQIATISGSRVHLQASAGTMAGAFIGFLTKTRSHDLAQILRDDCTLLNHASIHCTMLQTIATVMGRTAIFEVASAHQRELDALVSDLSELAPQYLRRQLQQTLRVDQRAAQGSVHDQDGMETPSSLTALA